MKKILKTLLGSALLATTLFTATSCKKDNEETEESKTDLLYGCEITSVDSSNISFVNKGKLTVGMSTDFAPSEFIDSTKKGQDQFVGCDVSFAKALATAFGVELEIKAISFDAILSSLDSNLIDIGISGFSYTPSRAASYLPTNCYWDEGDDGQVILTNKSSSSKFTDLASLNSPDVKIAVQSNSLQQLLVTEQIPNCTQVAVSNLDEAVTSLKSGSIDAIAFAGGVANTKIQLDNSLYIVPGKLDDTGYTGNFAWVKKGNTVLADACNQVISEVKEKNYYKIWQDNAKALVLALGDKAEEIIPEE